MCFACSFKASIISGIPDSIIRSSFSSSSESAHMTDIHSSQIEGIFNFVKRILITSLKKFFQGGFNMSKLKINNQKYFWKIPSKIFLRLQWLSYIRLHIKSKERVTLWLLRSRLKILFLALQSRGRRKRSLIIGFGSKRSYHRNQNDHDPGQQDLDHH